MIKQDSPDFPVLGKVLEHTVAAIMSHGIQQQQPSFQETCSVFVEFQAGKQQDECRSLLWQEFSPVPVCSLLGWGWWRGQAEDGSSHGRLGSGQILTQALVGAEAASDIHRKDGKGNKHCSSKNSCRPSVQCPPCTSVAHASY